MPGATTGGPAGAPIRVMSVDDHPIFVEALVQWLQAVPELEVVAKAHSGKRALALLPSAAPDVLLLDAALGSEDGVALIERLLRTAPQLRVVMLSAMTDPVQMAEAVRAGAAAWVPKSTSPNVLVDVIREVAKGRSWLPPALLGPVMDHLMEGTRPDADPGVLASLSPREHEVLQGIVDGLDRKQIAARLFLSPNTVRTHTQSILRKLSVHGSLEAAAVGVAAGMRPSDLPRQP
jgi:DNA-binding NarL/FixJ family response regulator